MPICVNETSASVGAALARVLMRNGLIYICVCVCVCVCVCACVCVCVCVLSLIHI